MIPSIPPQVRSSSGQSSVVRGKKAAAAEDHENLRKREEKKKVGREKSFLSRFWANLKKSQLISTRDFPK
jgi:hypothetical protein